MNSFRIDYIKSIRFERENDDGTKVSFSVEEPKAIGLTNARSLLTGKYGVDNIGGVSHSWESVFNSKTKIILVGKIVEIKPNVYSEIIYEGEFDFEELCKGNIVRPVN